MTYNVSLVITDNPQLPPNFAITMDSLAATSVEAVAEVVGWHERTFPGGSIRVMGWAYGSCVDRWTIR